MDTHTACDSEFSILLYLYLYGLTCINCLTNFHCHTYQFLLNFAIKYIFNTIDPRSVIKKNPYIYSLIASGH